MAESRDSRVVVAAAGRVSHSQSRVPLRFLSRAQVDPVWLLAEEGAGRPARWRSSSSLSEKSRGEVERD